MGRSRDHKVTLKDIAHEVGVSAMTVSRALSGKHDLVNAETVHRVKEVADRLGYSPNLLARSLRGAHLPTVVVFAEFISAHHYLAELSDFVTRQIESRGYSVITCQSSKSLLDVLRQFHLAGGVILAPPESLFFDAKGRPQNHLDIHEPLVLIHSAVEQPFLNEVSPDIQDAAFQAAQHLLSLGHRRLGFIGGPPLDAEPQWFRLRETGLLAALRAAGLGPAALTYQPCLSPEMASTALQQLLHQHPEITGLIAINDEQAVAAIHGAREMGLAVPKKLSVVGSNDIRLARFFQPALTTLGVDVQALVESGLNLLFDDIRLHRTGRPERPMHVKQKCQLIVRDSTARAPK